MADDVKKRIAAGILLAAPSGRALFMKRSPTAKDHANEWGFPFGSLEGEETPEQAAVRETAEETGLTGLLVGEMTQIDDAEGYVTFRAPTKDEFSPTLNDEHTEYAWASLDEPPQPLHPGVAATLRKLRDASPIIVPAASAQDKRVYDVNDWYEVTDNPLSRVGVYTYSEASVREGGDPNKMVSVYRPAEELGSPECIESFKLVPWTDDHPDALLGDPEKGFASIEDKGARGVTGEKIYFRDDVLYGNLKVFSEKLARTIAAGKKELSLGYHCKYVPQDGVFNGKPYQYVQRGMRGNHVSSVKAGRMGTLVSVQDAAERFTFALDLKEAAMEACKECGRTHGAQEDCMDAETTRFVCDSFESLVGELEKKGYSKSYATKVAGKVAAEKGKTGHDSIVTGVIAMTDKVVKPVLTARDGVSSEEESTMDTAEETMDREEECKDADEEKSDKDKDDKEARDRKSARDRRAGARDARRGARDSRKGARDRAAAKDAKAAQDAADAKAAKDAADAAAAGKGLDEAAVQKIVKTAVDAAVPNTADIVAKVRKEENAKAGLYGRISPLVGAFDHAEMTHVQMAAYGLKKLGVTQESADPVTALDFFLAGRAQGSPGARSAALDAARPAGGSLVDKYLSNAA